MFDLPGLKINLGHLGEGLPFAIPRLNERPTWPAWRRVVAALGAVGSSLPRPHFGQLCPQLQRMLLDRIVIIVMGPWKDHLEVGLKMPVERLIPRTRETERLN